MTRGLYFLRPLTGERIRDGDRPPAAAKGVAFESEELVDALVEQTELAPGGLPLLQFALRRDLGRPRRRGPDDPRRVAGPARRGRRRADPPRRIACSTGSTPMGAKPRAGSCSGW